MDNIDSQVEFLLKESFEMIPILFADDAAMRLRLTERIPAMHAYTKKVYWALGARSPIEHCMLCSQLGNAFVTANPKAVLDCTTMADFFKKMTDWVQATLKIEFTEEDFQGKEALEAISQKIATQVNAKLSKLRHGS